MVKNCPNVRIRGKRNGQAQPRYHSFEALKRNRFCALKTRGEKESSPDVVTGMLEVFSVNVYALHDEGANISFVTPLVDRKFDVLPDVLIEPF